MEQLEELFPLTLPQEDIYYDQILYPDIPFYNIGAKIEIHGFIDVNLLKKAYSILIDQHDAYRLIIDQQNNAPHFYILPKHHSELEYIDYSNDANSQKLALDYLNNNFKIPFQLEERTLLHRFTLIKVRSDFYYLYSVYHHIITDGWGTSLMFQRLVNNYNELLREGKVTSTYPFFYKEFSLDDLEYKNSQHFENDKKYWLGQFSVLPESFIPLIDNKKEIYSHRKELLIKRETYNSLNGVAKQLNISTFQVILGILYTYFGRYYNVNDFAIGIPVLNRGKSNFRKTVGLFMGVTPLRIQFDLEESFEQLTIRIKNQLKQDYRHQRFPLGKLIQELRLYEERNRIFNITLSYEKQNYADHFLNTITNVVPLTHESERVALAIYIREFDEQKDVKIDFDYNKSYFNESSINQLVSSFGNILHQIIIDPHKELKNIDYIPKSEKDKILYEFNNTVVTYSKHKTIIDLFNEQTKLFSGKVAVRDENKKLTYTELNQYVDRIASLIQSTVVAKKSPIAILLDRSVYLLSVILGVIKSGHPYIPLDPSFPTQRLDYIIQHSKCETIIIEKENSDKFYFGNCSHLYLGDLLASSSNDSADNFLPAPQDTAYIIYTSGSTGDPKGIEISHQSLVNFLCSMRNKPGINSDDILYAVTTYSFDISILELLLPTISGATVYIATNNILSSTSRTINDINKISPTVIQATPSFYQMLFNAGWKGNRSLKLLCGGDLLSELLAKRLIESCKEVWNMYGPTETTIWSSTKKIVSPKDANNIGKPINNTSFCILDRWLNPLPIGAAGYIYIGGHGLAKGYYLNDPLTNDRFIYTSAYIKQRLYNTGDIGKWNNNGEIEILGRSDFQVKIRGYRIELGEIERNLLDIPSVTEAVLVAQELNGEKALVAFIKMQEEFNENLITEYLQRVLPEYMIPKIIVEIQEFPLTPNKKIDRKALTARKIDNKLNEDYELPQNEVEEKIINIWKNILNLNHLSVTDNFFKIGGHSLSAVRVIYELNEFFKFNLYQRDIFNNPTVRSLSNIIINKLGEITLNTSIPKVENKDFYGLTYPQRNIWILSQNKDASIAYNMNAVYEIIGDLQVYELNKALLHVISKYEALRTNFIEVEGAPKQKIKRQDEINFEIDILRFSNEDNIDEIISSIFYKEFDLQNDLLLRVKLLLVEENKKILVFSTHHIIMDGWSIEIFIRDLIVTYSNLIKGKALNNKDDIIQFKDYSEWLNNQPLDIVARNFWLENLKGYKVKDSFIKDLQKDKIAYNGHQITIAFSKTEKDGLTELAYSQNCTLFSLLISMITSFIYKYSGHKDICVGTVDAGRNDETLSSCIGMFVNTFPLRIKLNGEETFIQFLDNVKRQIIETTSYSNCNITDTLPQYANIFDVLIAYQNPDFNLKDIYEFENFKLKSVTHEHKVSRFPLTFNFYQGNSNLHCDIEYNTDCYLYSTIEIIIAKLKKFIDKVIKEPSLAIKEYEIKLDIEKKLIENIQIDFNF